jgi:hypothetical protein
MSGMMATLDTKRDGWTFTSVFGQKVTICITKWNDTLPGMSTNIEAPAEYFLFLNKVQEYDAPVVSFSHFLPRFELLPNRVFMKKTLPLVQLLALIHVT